MPTPLTTPTAVLLSLLVCLFAWAVSRPPRTPRSW